MRTAARSHGSSTLRAFASCAGIASISAKRARASSSAFFAAARSAAASKIGISVRSVSGGVRVSVIPARHSTKPGMSKVRTKWDMRQLFTIAAVALVAASLVAATPDQLFAAGKTALAHDEWDKAADLFEQAVKANPGNAQYHFFLGRAYGEKAGHASMFSAPGLATKTREQFELAVQLDPNYTDARFGLIEYYMQAPGFLGGGEEKAMQQAQELRKRDPLIGHRAFALIYTRQKKPDLARKEYYDA